MSYQPTDRECESYKSDWIDRQFDLAVKQSLDRSEVSLLRELWGEATYGHEMELAMLWRRRDPRLFDRLEDLFAAHLMPLAEEACAAHDWDAHERARREDEEYERTA